MVGRRCAAKTCFNTRSTRPGLKFFNFPKAEWYARAWAEACGRPDLTGKTMEMLTRYVLCSEHFEDRCFLNPKHKAAFIRTETPLPTIFRDNFNEHMFQRFGKKIAASAASVTQEGENGYTVEVRERGNQRLCRYLTGIDAEDGKKRRKKKRTFEVNEDNNELVSTFKSDQGEDSFSVDDGKLELFIVENVDEARNGEQDTHKFCRLCACLVPTNLLASIFDMHLDIRINKLFPDSLHAFKDDGLPKEVCGSCIEKLTICDESIQEFLNADRKLRELHETQENMNSIISPLVNIPDAKKSQDVYNANEQSDDRQDVLPNDIMHFVEANNARQSFANIARDTQGPLVDIKSGTMLAKTNRVLDSLQQERSCQNIDENQGNSILPDIAVNDSDLNFQAETIVNEETVEKTQYLCTTANKTNEIMVYKCMECDREFMNRDVLEEHSLESHQIVGSDHQIKYSMVKKQVVKTQQLRRYKCMKCSAEFSRNRMYRSHLRSHLPRSSMCEFCGIHFTRKSQLESHRRLHTKETPYHCGDCGESFIFRNSYRRHKKSHAIAKPANECEKCKKMFPSVSHLRKHVKIHEHERGLLCNLCGKVLSTPQSLKVHLKTHNDDRPYMCTVCLKMFRTSSQLNHHSQTHRKEKRFECTECSKKFHTKGLLRQHMNSHSGTKQYACEICGTRFNRSGNLGQHRKKHAETTDLNDVSIKCQICNKRLKSEYSFKHHMAKHNGEKKPYSCDVCDKRFSTPMQLKVHQRLHTGERPYVCSVCDKPFRSDATMKQHYRTFHTDNYPHQCPYCERRFKRLQSLIVHKKTHTGERPFSCPVCGRAFAQKGDMIKHTKIHGQAKRDNATSESQDRIYIEERMTEETIIRAIEAEQMTILTLSDADIIADEFLISIPNVEAEAERPMLEN